MSSRSQDFIETFKGLAEPVLSRHPQLQFTWDNNPKNDAYTLRILKTSETGFDVGVEVQTYGLYVFAGDWHGATWDINTPNTSVIAMCRSALGYLRALLCNDTRLRVRSAGGRAFKWFLEVATPNGWAVSEEMGLLFFRFFSTRSEQTFQNEQLPPLGFTLGTVTLEAFNDLWV